MSDTFETAILGGVKKGEEGRKNKKAEPFLTLPFSLPGISRILTSFF
jgi:hypothetical protein